MTKKKTAKKTTTKKADKPQAPAMTTAEVFSMSPSSIQHIVGDLNITFSASCQVQNERGEVIEDHKAGDEVTINAASAVRWIKCRNAYITGEDVPEYWKTDPEPEPEAVPDGRAPDAGKMGDYREQPKT